MNKDIIEEIIRINDMMGIKKKILLETSLFGLVDDLTDKFFIKLKEYITGESIDIRDLYFKHAGRLAIWSYENLKCQI